MPHRGLTRQVHRAGMDGERAVDLLEGNVVDRAEGEDAGVVDEDVEPAEFGDSLLDRGHDRVRGSTVRFDREATLTVRPDLVDHLAGALLRPGVGDRDVRPALGQPRRDRGSDPPAAARHQRRLADQLRHAASISVSFDL
jgi:hypothetical protein